jgi:hypothetical protein
MWREHSFNSIETQNGENFFIIGNESSGRNVEYSVFVNWAYWLIKNGFFGGSWSVGNLRYSLKKCYVDSFKGKPIST